MSQSEEKNAPPLNFNNLYQDQEQDQEQIIDKSLENILYFKFENLNYLKKNRYDIITDIYKRTPDLEKYVPRFYVLLDNGNYFELKNIIAHRQLLLTIENILTKYKDEE